MAEGKWDRRRSSRSAICAAFRRDPNYFAIRDSLQRIAAAENILYVRRYDAMQFIARRMRIYS